MGRRKDGSLFPQELSLTITEGGRMICVVRDITERQRMEEALRKSEEKYRLLIESSHDIIYTVTPDGTFTFASPSWTALLGHPVDEVVGKKFQQFVHADDLDRCTSFLQRAADTGQRQSGIEYRVRHADGSWRWHTSNAVPIWDGAGTFVGLEGNARDITEQTLEILKLSGSNSRMHAAMVPHENGEPSHDILPEMVLTDIDAMLMVDMNGKIVRTGKEWESTHGFEGIGVGGSIFDIIHPDDLGRSRAWLSDSRNADFADELLNRLVAKDGTYLTLEWRQFVQGDAVCGYLIEVKSSEPIVDRMKDLVEASEDFLKESPGEMDPEFIAETVTKMSGAKMGAFNLYNDDGSEYTTVAIAITRRRPRTRGSSIHDKQDDFITERGRKFLGFDAIGKTWKHDTERAKKIEGRTITKFASLRALSGDIVPSPIMYLIERTFRTGEAAVIKIERDGHMLGDFTLIMPSGSKLANEDLVEIYSRLVGTMLIRRKTEKRLMELSERLSLATRAGGVGIWDLDVVNNKLTWDSQMFKLYGIQEGRFGGAYEAWKASLHTEDVQRGDEEIQMALRGEKEYDTEFRVLWPDGTIRHIQALALVQRDATGRPLRMVGTNWNITERKQAEATLRDSEEEIRLLLNSAAEAVYGLDLEGNCTFCNSSCQRLLGYDRPGDLLGKSMHWLIHGKHADGSRYELEDCKISKALLQGESAHLDNEVLWRSDGTSFPAEYWSHPKIQDGRIVGAVVSFLDITERKRAEETLKESESRFREIFNSVNDAIYINELSPDFKPGAIIDVNDAACQMLGYSREELLHLTPQEFAPNRNPSDLERIYLEMKVEGRAKFEEEQLRRDGTLVPVEINARRIEFLGRPVSLAVARDITERKRTEELLRQNEETLRLLVDAAPFPLMITDDDGTYILDANHKAMVFFDLKLKQGQTLGTLFILEGELQRIMETARAQGFVENAEVTVRALGGEARRTMISLRSMHHLGDKRWIIGTYDITERHAMERALQQASEKLSMLNSITRHDVFNQVLALSGYIELCKLKEKDATLQTYLNRMTKAADSIREQIAFTKEYQDIGVKAPAWALPGRQTAEAFAMLHPVGVELEDDTKGVEVMADPLAEKVPYNLIDNSMRHGKHVTRIKMSVEQVGDAMLIVYEDNGAGISDEDKKRLFEKGFGKNTGFGLFLCREILAITGITITETGKAGEGVRFEMLVPPGAWRPPPR